MGKIEKVKAGKPQSVTHGDLTIAVGDCILINPDEPGGLPYIGKVKDMVKDHKTTMLQVTWFYRPEEAVGGRKAFHGEKELFNSDHPDQCDIQTVLGKCRVMTLRKYQELDPVGDHDYFTRFTYKPARKEFEPDRVPVFCVCEMPYNPDKFMVCCDACEDWYHPECLHLTRKQVQAVPCGQWSCPDCKKKQEAEADKRQRVL